MPVTTWAWLAIAATNALARLLTQICKLFCSPAAVAGLCCALFRPDDYKKKVDKLTELKHAVDLDKDEVEQIKKQESQPKQSSSFGNFNMAEASPPKKTE